MKLTIIRQQNCNLNTHRHTKRSTFSELKKNDNSDAFCKELDAAVGSSLVRDMMVVKFEREVSVLLLDEAELRKKAQEIRSRVAERDFVLGELELLFAFDSTLQSIAELTSLQTEDLTEVAAILVNVMKKQTRAAEILLVIEKLKSLPYKGVLCWCL